VAASGDAVARGLAAARLPGRLEIVGERPQVIVDGAHNPHAARALAAELAAMPPARTVLVIGVSADKDVDAVLAPLVALADAVVVTRSRNERAAPVDDLAGRVGAGLAAAEPSVAAAVTRARALAGPAGRVLVTGSLFVVGEVREALLGEPADPVAVSDPL
jgi:dihydrofolate synthase/folylpolyglutamate synthase